MRVRAITCSAQLSWRSPPRLRRWRRIGPLEASTGLVPASAAKEASLFMRVGSPLETTSWAAQTGPAPHSSSSSGASVETICFSWLSRSAQDRGEDLLTVRAGTQTQAATRERRAAQASQPLAQLGWAGDKDGVQLVERRGLGAQRAAPFEQEQAQVVSRLAAAAQAAEAVAAEQAAGGAGRVEQIALATPTLAPPWPLDLVDGKAAREQQRGEAGAVAARAFDRERRLTQRLGELQQPQVADPRRLDLAACELGAEPVERDRRVRVLVRVDPDCDRPLHHLASFAVGQNDRGGTGLCPAMAQASIRSPAGRVGRGGRQVQKKALKPAWCRVIPPPLHSQQPTGRQPASTQATQLGARDPEARRHYWKGH